MKSPALALTVGSVAMARPAPTAQPAVAALVRNTEQATSRGTRFMVSREWTVDLTGQAVHISAPEVGSRVAIVEAAEADPDAAVQSARVAEGMPVRRPLKVATERLAQDGWDAIRRHDYDLGPTTCTSSGRGRSIPMANGPSPSSTPPKRSWGSATPSSSTG